MSATTTRQDHPRVSLERVHDALHGLDCRPQQRGAHIDSRCPAHDDGSASLSVDWRDGRTLIMCHAGCQTSAVLDALTLGMPDLFDAPPARPERTAARPARRVTSPKPQTPPAGPKCRHAFLETARYAYADEAGTVLGYMIRKSCQRPGCSGKTFGQRHVTPTGGTKAGAPARRVLYRLPEVLAAVTAGSTVYVVEGEKDADALAAEGVTATTNPGGSDNSGKHGSKWLAEHTAALATAGHVVIVADRDAAGFAHARYVRDELAAAGVQRIDVVGAAVLEAKADASDHLAAGHAVAELVPVDLDDEPTAAPVPPRGTAPIPPSGQRPVSPGVQPLTSGNTRTRRLRSN